VPISWRLAGEYLENCNCEVLCPCSVGPRSERGGTLARPTQGYCDVPVVFRIDRGMHGDVRLDGLAAAWAMESHRAERTLRALRVERSVTAPPAAPRRLKRIILSGRFANIAAFAWQGPYCRSSEGASRR
jgi:hypothetical protein